MNRAWLFIGVYLLSLIGIGWLGKRARLENTLADFYLGAAYLCLAALAFTYGYAAFRIWSKRASKRSVS